jgi:hypothetical protein
LHQSSINTEEYMAKPATSFKPVKPVKAARGRTARTRPSVGDEARSAVKPAFPVEQRTEASRPISGGGGGKHRGDRRDMSKTYTGSERHAARGNTPRKDVKTRKR